MTEKEIILDLSKKIKLGEKRYISIGTLVISLIILLIQLLMYLSLSNWVWDAKMWTLLLNFAYSIRSGKIEEQKDNPI